MTRLEGLVEFGFAGLFQPGRRSFSKDSFYDVRALLSRRNGADSPKGKRGFGRQVKIGHYPSLDLGFSGGGQWFREIGLRSLPVPAGWRNTSAGRDFHSPGDAGIGWAGLPAWFRRSRKLFSGSLVKWTDSKRISRFEVVGYSGVSSFQAPSQDRLGALPYRSAFSHHLRPAWFGHSSGVPS